jgi:hypothetical protein
VPDTDTDAAGKAALPELPGARGVGLERIPVRTREAGVTLSAWRLRVESDRGPGEIVLVEAAGREPIYRGEGILLGWPQDRLSAAYAALRPVSDEPGLELQQMG